MWEDHPRVLYLRLVSPGTFAILASNPGMLKVRANHLPKLLRAAGTDRFNALSRNPLGHFRCEETPVHSITCAGHWYGRARQPMPQASRANSEKFGPAVGSTKPTAAYGAEATKA